MLMGDGVKPIACAIHFAMQLLLVLAFLKKMQLRQKKVTFTPRF
jgi:hypothetical protein